jgi:hypothetical protein
MDWLCSVHGGDEKYKILVGNHEGKRPLAGSCEHSIEISGSINGSEFLD